MVAVGWSLLVVGAGVMLWALFWDRARGRLRCPKCWYRLEGLVQVPRDDAQSVTCPECGGATRANDFARIRRRWWWAAFGMVIALLGPRATLYGTPGMEGGKWIIPTCVLALIVDDIHGDSPKALLIAERLLDGRSATILDQTLTRLVIAHAERRTIPTRPRELVVVRDKWPVGEPLRVQLRGFEWHRSFFDRHGLRIRSKTDDGNEASWTGHPMGWCVMVASRPPDYLLLPAPGLGPNRYKLLAEFTSNDRLVKRCDIAVDVEGVPNISDVLKRSDTLPPSFIRNLTWRYEIGMDGPTLLLVLDPHVRTSFPVVVDVAKGTHVFLGELGTWSEVHVPVSLPLDHDVQSVPSRELSIDDISVELYCDPQACLHALWVDGYWTGRETLSLREIPMLVDTSGTRVLLNAHVDQVPLLEDLTPAWIAANGHVVKREAEPAESQ